MARGERVGLIKFGSRVDVIFTSESDVAVKIGDHVAGGSTILAVARVGNLQVAGAERIATRRRTLNPLNPSDPMRRKD